MSCDYLHIEEGLVPLYREHLRQDHQVILRHKGRDEGPQPVTRYPTLTIASICNVVSLTSRVRAWLVTIASHTEKLKGKVWSSHGTN